MESYGNPREILWNPIEILWKSIEIRWKCFGNPMEILGESYGNPMEILWVLGICPGHGVQEGLPDRWELHLFICMSIVDQVCRLWVPWGRVGL